MSLRTILFTTLFVTAAAAQAKPPCPVAACSQFNAGTAGCGFCQGCEAAGGDPSIHKQGDYYRVDCNVAPPNGAQHGLFGAQGAAAHVRPLPGRAVARPPRSARGVE